jgi:hypothetical protein
MKKTKSDPDPYLPKLYEHWGALTAMHRAFEDREPIIEFDVVSERILAYGAEEYINQLTQRTREQTRKQYRKAVAEGALMVFVRDDSEEILLSYVFPPANDSAGDP